MANPYAPPTPQLTAQMNVSQHALANMTPGQLQQYQNLMQAQMQQQLAAQAAWQGLQVMPGSATVYTSVNPVTQSVILTSTATTSASTSTWNSAGNFITYNPTPTHINMTAPPSPYATAHVLGRLHTVKTGEACKIYLPDGSIIDVEESGSYQIDDKNAKVIYRANKARDFNRYINVSDRIEEFFAFCGEQDVSAEEMMELPMNLFIGWLVLKAAETDGEAPPDVKLLPDLRSIAAKAALPRCRCCGRFIRHVMHKADLEFCSAPCYGKVLVAA